MTKEDGEKMSGNWISAVAPAKGKAAEAAKKDAPKPAPKPETEQEPAPVDDFDDDIPF